METNKRIVLIGAGNVATHLGLAWKKAGVEVVQVYSRTEQSARELGRRLNVPYVTSLEDVCTDADIYVVAVKDDALPEVIPDLTNGREQAMFVHTAGSVPMSVWSGYAPRHGVIYPMQTFSKIKEVDLTKVYFFVEANNEYEMLMEFTELITRNAIQANSRQRMSVHLAAVFACNFANHMYALSAKLLEKHGLAFEGMLSLIDETAAKVHEVHPRRAQTGPAARGDKSVMDKHLSMLADEPDLQRIYKMLSDSIQNL